jgi:hypothetical protein
MSDDSTRCPHVSSCAMYDLFVFEASLSLWKRSYCFDDFERCARYQLSQEGQDVPLQLLPNGRQLSTGE